MSIIKTRAKLDHLVFTSRSLGAGCDEIERLLGIRPVKGGSHPKWGTHNAVLSLDNYQYIEVISLNPSSKIKYSPIMGIKYGETENLRLSTWCCTAAI